MKHFAVLCVSVLLMISCNQNKNKSENSDTTSTPEANSEKELNPLEEIAYANGYENWKDVDSIAYTFNVKMGENQSYRSWVWKPKTGEVTLKTIDTTLTYNTANVEGDIAVADRRFINDKYWLLFPYQLVWDDNFDFEIADSVKAPISGEMMQEIAIMYKNQAGYTPGDTYHIYVNDEKMIKEWTYTPSGSQEPRMATTWEDYENFEGIKIAKTHQNQDGSFKLYFTDISVN
jgi:hypothetical protein